MIESLFLISQKKKEKPHSITSTNEKTTSFLQSLNITKRVKKKKTKKVNVRNEQEMILQLCNNVFTC